MGQRYQALAKNRGSPPKLGGWREAPGWFLVYREPPRLAALGTPPRLGGQLHSNESGLRYNRPPDSRVNSDGSHFAAGQKSIWRLRLDHHETDETSLRSFTYVLDHTCRA